MIHLTTEPGPLFRVKMECVDTFWPVWRFRAAGFLQAVERGLELARREVEWRRTATGQRHPPAGSVVTVTVTDPDGQTTSRTVRV